MITAETPPNPMNSMMTMTTGLVRFTLITKLIEMEPLDILNIKL